jgi:hypothetical protein
MLFLPGLNSVEYETYVNAIVENHWTKNYNFGSLGTAVVFDSEYNVKYEVVYINIIDPEENANDQGAPLEIDLSGQIVNPYIDAQGNEFTVIYPNNSANMATRVLNGVGYYDQSSLPEWMTSDQLGTSSSSTFNPPLGYVKAVVLAYTKPVAGQPAGYSSNLVAYRIQNSGFAFENLAFTVDRYNLDNVYSANFDTTANAYISGSETTFDYLPITNVGALSATVNYAVSVPFDQLNGRPIDYIINNGGIDGAINFSAGQTLVFAQQENFATTDPYDGWVDYLDAYIGENISNPAIDGYDSESYDDYYVIPGYLENVQATQVITGNSQINTYTMSQNVTNTASVSVYINDVLQNSATYVISGTTIQFNSNPANVSVAPSNAQISVYSGVNLQTFSSNGTVTQFALSPSVSIPTTVVVNGIVQSMSAYSLSTQTVTASGFVVGQTYTIATIGTTDFTQIGALSNTVGATFTATGAGTGTGTAQYVLLTFNVAPPLITHPDLPPTIKIVQGGNTQNQRGGIWEIQIIGGVVSLVFVQEVVVNTRVQVIGGKTYAGSILSYTNNLTTGHTVPYYKVYSVNATQIKNRVRTTFNGDTTRFFSYRDQYYTPGSEDQFVKFPQAGPFL